MGSSGLLFEGCHISRVSGMLETCREMQVKCNVRRCERSIGRCGPNVGRCEIYHISCPPSHSPSSNICKQFIDESIPHLLDWPSNSPDANPVENIWSIVKRNVEKRKPLNINELRLFLAEEFENIDINVVKNCVMSMKKRRLSLINCKGERIKY